MRFVGNWQLETPIGSGSFAVVWRAKHKDTAVVAAVKEIHTAKLTGKLQASLASEVSVLQRTSHGNLVGLLDIVKEEDRLFLVLEFCAGGDLGHFLRRYGPVPETCARHLLQQLARGLQALRAENLMHRDLKPQNLLLCDGSSMPFLKIADFGFARSLQPQGLAETLCGSPLYMAPEILQFHKYDAKADLWSVGAILFELLTGKPPFNGANHLQLLQNIERGEGGRLPVGVAASLSPSCKQLLQQLLRRNPLERISYEEFFTHPFLHANSLPTPGVMPAHTHAPAHQHQHHSQGADVVSSNAAQAVAAGGQPAAAAAGILQATQAGGPPRVAYTGPLLGVHEATGISVRTALMQPPTSLPPLFSSSQQPSSAASQQPGSSDTQPPEPQTEPFHGTAALVGDDGLQYTDIDLGPSPSPSPAPLGLPYRSHDPPPGGLSVIEECDDYVVISTEPSPTSSTYGVQGTPAGLGIASTPGGSNGGASSSTSGGRGRAAWDALSRVGPALLPPRLVASAASQLRNAAAASHHVNTWVAPLGQLASQVAQGGTAALTVNRPSIPGISASTPTLTPVATDDCTQQRGLPSRATDGGVLNASATTLPMPTPQESSAAAPTTPPPTPLPIPSLTQLMRLPEGIDLLDLASRVLHILGQVATRTWDMAVTEAELAAAAAAAAAVEGTTTTGAGDSGVREGDSRGMWITRGNSVDTTSFSGGRAGKDTWGALAGGGVSEDEVQAALAAAAMVLRPAALEVVATHLLCAQLLTGALDALEVGQTEAAVRMGAAGPRQQHMLLASLGRSVLGSLQPRCSLAGLHLPPDQVLPSGTDLLYTAAAQLSRAAALDELMGQYSASVQQYAKAADLLLFLLLTTRSQASAELNSKATGGASSSATISPSTWAHVLQAMPSPRAAHVHQLYVATRIRQSACMSDLNAQIKSA